MSPGLKSASSRPVNLLQEMYGILHAPDPSWAYGADPIVGTCTEPMAHWCGLEGAKGVCPGDCETKVPEETNKRQEPVGPAALYKCEGQTGDLLLTFG